jgi:hypothetical protein
MIFDNKCGVKNNRKRKGILIVSYFFESHKEHKAPGRVGPYMPYVVNNDNGMNKSTQHFLFAILLLSRRMRGLFPETDKKIMELGVSSQAKTIPDAASLDFLYKKMSEK